MKHPKNLIEKGLTSLLNQGMLIFLVIVLLMSIVMPVKASAPEEDPAEEIFTEVSFSIKDTLLNICAMHGYGEECGKILIGMMWKESRNDPTAIGDGGRARGYYQIHYRLHGISIECAEDLICSSEWAIGYLEQHGYPNRPTYAVQCHNHCSKNNAYASAVLRHGKRLWEESSPMTIASDAASL